MTHTDWRREKVAAMESLQIRLPVIQIKKIRKLVEKGDYPSQSDVIRDAVRKFLKEV